MSRPPLKRLGAALTATLTAASLIAAAPVPTSSIKATSAEFRGDLQIDVTEAGRTAVVVPDDTVVSLADITVEVAHGFAGIILTDLDDDSGFSLRAIRYPETETYGSSHVMKNIEVAEGDAEPSTYPGGPSSRSCNADCRLPAGTYTLLAITEDGVAASLGLDLGDGATAVADESLTPIRIVVDDPDPLGGDFDTLESHGGARATSQSPVSGRAFAFQQVSTRTTSTGAGIVYVEHCHTLDGECSSTIGFNVYHPTAVTTDGSTSFIQTELAPGAHGSHVSWSVEAVGGGELTIAIDALRVYPD